MSDKTIPISKEAEVEDIKLYDHECMNELRHRAVEDFQKGDPKALEVLSEIMHIVDNQREREGKRTYVGRRKEVDELCGS